MKRSALWIIFVFCSWSFSQDWLQQTNAQIAQCSNLNQVDSLVTVTEQQLQTEPHKLLRFYRNVFPHCYKVRERQLKKAISEKDQEQQIKIGRAIEQQFMALMDRITQNAAELCEKVDQSVLDDDLRAYCKTFKMMEAYHRFEQELKSKPRPDFQFTDLSGKVHHLYDFKGKYVLLNFWNMHSTPCVEELPFLRQAFEKYASKGLVLINFHLKVGHIDEKWESDALKNLIQETEMPGIQVAGAQALRVKEQYFVRNFPTLFLLNPQGFVIKPSGNRTGFKDELRGAKLLQTLQEVFGQ